MGLSIRARSDRIRPSLRERGVQDPFDLPPCGSLLLFLSTEDRLVAAAAEIPKCRNRKRLPRLRAPSSRDPLKIRRLGPNVLTLDYIDVAAGGQTQAGLYFYHANQFAFQQNGMERNPWDSAVQFKDELIRKRFPPKSGFAATYQFTIEGPVPRPLWIVIERPDLYPSLATASRSRPARRPGGWTRRSAGSTSPRRPGRARTP